MFQKSSQKHVNLPLHIHLNRRIFYKAIALPIKDIMQLFEGVSASAVVEL